MDILLWPNNIWVFKDDYTEEEYSWLSDDYHVVTQYTPEWYSLVGDDFKE